MDEKEFEQALDKIQDSSVTQKGFEEALALLIAGALALGLPEEKITEVLRGAFIVSTGDSNG